MSCFYHPERDTFAYCSDCGREICNECAFGSDGTFFCSSCCEREVLAEAYIARKRLNGAQVTAIICGLFSAFVAFAASPGSAGGILAKTFSIAATAYLGWSVYLVLPEVMDWWQRRFGEPSTSPHVSPVQALLRMTLFVFAPLIASCYYGMLGGGIRTYLRMRRVAEIEPSD